MAGTETNAPLLLGDVLTSPAGTAWTVVRGSRLSSGVRRVRSSGGAVRWVHPAEVEGWARRDALQVYEEARGPRGGETR